MTQAILGGMLIGLSAVLLYAGLGRIAGISGIAFGMLEPAARHWRLPFLAGLVGGGWLAVSAGVALTPWTIPQAGGAGLLALAGLLVGAGTALGNGCTSGHGICGLARLSPRSLAAVATFMLVGMAAATLLRGALS